MFARKKRRTEWSSLLRSIIYPENPLFSFFLFFFQNWNQCLFFSSVTHEKWIFHASIKLWWIGFSFFLPFSFLLLQITRKFIIRPWTKKFWSVRTNFWKKNWPHYSTYWSIYLSTMQPVLTTNQILRCYGNTRHYPGKQKKKRKKHWK